MVAVAAAPLMGGLALSVDYATIYSKSAELQDLADSAALAVAKEMSLANSKTLDVTAIATSYATSRLKINSTESIDVKAVRDAEETSVNVSLSYTWKPFFAQFIDSKALPIVVDAKAGYTGGNSSLCVLGLDTSTKNTVIVGPGSSVTANGCSLFSNSTSSKGLNTKPTATIQADSIQTAGGYSGADNSYTPFPITDAPPVADPLASRVAPTVGACDYTNFVVKGNVTQTLKPGVYCNGLDVGGKAIAKLEPGTYIMKDGPLSIRGNSSIIGEHVGFYFTGTDAVFDFRASTQVVLSAPKSGELSGILFFEDRNSVVDRVFAIRSKDAEKFEGTVYLPKGTLFINKASRVGQLSKWTAIIVKKLKIGTGPALVVNSDYANSDVPVPDGIGSNSQTRLLK